MSRLSEPRGNGPLVAESRLLFQRFAENLTAAILPNAAAKLELRKTAADDPKRTFVLQSKNLVETLSEGVT